ncbi:MAG TPA: hypothetical protein VEY67_02810, partial [Candidatus Dormibacteraeota bacterium]|nr:hypothetical protein [Candidatus Dormibacteraeota bacterium]
MTTTADAADPRASEIPSAEAATAYRSDRRPETTPFDYQPPTVRGFAYAGDLRSEIAAGRSSVPAALALLDDMLAIRE